MMIRDVVMNEVDAIKSKGEIEIIEKLMRKHHGDLYGDIWRIGINVALRVSDLLGIMYRDLDIENRSVTITESKTGKSREIRLSKSVIDVIQRRRKEYPRDVWLFEVHSNRCINKPVNRSTVARAFKDIGDRIGVKLGTHSMRKTKGYHMYADGVGIELICRLLNHSSTGVTLKYIGITKEDIQRSYDEYDL